MEHAHSKTIEFVCQYVDRDKTPQDLINLGCGHIELPPACKPNYNYSCMPNHLSKIIKQSDLDFINAFKQQAQPSIPNSAYLNKLLRIRRRIKDEYYTMDEYYKIVLEHYTSLGIKNDVENRNASYYDLKIFYFTHVVPALERVVTLMEYIDRIESQLILERVKSCESDVVKQYMLVDD